MKISKELIRLQVLEFNTDATNLIVGHIVTASIKCGVGQIKKQALERNHAVLMPNVMDFITNVLVHAAFDLEKMNVLNFFNRIENININDFSLIFLSRTHCQLLKTIHRLFCGYILAYLINKLYLLNNNPGYWNFISIYLLKNETLLITQIY